MADIQDDFFIDEIQLPEADQDLIRAYREVGRSVDDLAYTEDFDRLYNLYQQSGHVADKHDVFRRLLILRKSGLLPRLFRPSDSPRYPASTS